MRKNFTYDVKVVCSRNELIDAVESKSMVIELSGSIIEEIKKEYQKSVRTEKIAKAYRNLGGLTFILSIANPAVGLGELLFFGATALVSGGIAKSVELKSYALTAFLHKEKEHIILIRYANFDDKLDSISGFEDLRFSRNKNCPKCENKIKFNKKTMGPECCTKCASSVVYYKR